MFKITFLPATFGDCIFIEYGDEQEPNRILVDGGTAGTREHIQKILTALPHGQRHLELVVVTHIDNDHIAGILTLLEEEAEAATEKKLEFTIGDFWFNGWPHLHEDPQGIELYGAEQGEKLTKQICDHELSWNKNFRGKAVAVPKKGELPRKRMPGGMELSLLSPRTEDLKKMKTVWKKELIDAGLVIGLSLNETPSIEGVERYGTPSTGLLDLDALASSEFDPDVSPANRSSIALVAEYDGKRVLFAADAHAEVLQASLQRYQPDGKAQFDLVKVSHHGAQGTTSLNLVKALDCKRYMFSTNGSSYYHPHAEAVARVIVATDGTPELVFNYKTKHNSVWEGMAGIPGRNMFRTTYPQSGKSGISVVL